MNPKTGTDLPEGGSEAPDENGASDESAFLPFFYRNFIICGVAGTLLCFFFGVSAGGSFGFGFFSIALILFLWHFTLQNTLKPRKTSAGWESLMVFVRYFLLGGLFYGIISLFVVNWAWYVAGTVTLVVSLLISTILYDKKISI